MQSVGAFCLALVVGWLTVLIAYPNALTLRAVVFRVIVGIVFTAAAGLLSLKLGATTHQLISAGSGLVAGLTGCAALRNRAKMHSEH